MSGYRISVGREQQITPRDIVGAFTNEAQLPIRSIGRIKIEAQSSYIELSSNLPPKAIAKLAKLQIRHNHIGLRPESNSPAEHRNSENQRPTAAPKGKSKKWERKDKRRK
jgi:ATP-dependent RNA helicase DeaD